MGDAKFIHLLAALGLTILSQIILEVLSSTLFPIMGLHEFRLSFNVLIVLFLAFKFNSTFLPFIILTIQWFHSIFSIEGWALGTFAGILIAMLVNYTKELLDFSSRAATMAIVAIFQVIWFVLTSIVLSVKAGDFSYLLDRYVYFLPEVVILTVLSPFFFAYLSRVWSFLNRQDGIDL